VDILTLTRTNCNDVPYPQKKGDSDTNPIASLKKRRECAKVNAAAGMVRMARFVASQW
jgi:hypothetical protein